jgi:hypothetical protein
MNEKASLKSALGIHRQRRVVHRLDYCVRVGLLTRLAYPGLFRLGFMNTTSRCWTQPDLMSTRNHPSPFFSWKRVGQRLPKSFRP